MTMVDKPVFFRNKYTVAVLVAALVIRVAAAVWWHSRAAGHGDIFQVGDSHSYWTLASHLARFEPYEYGSPDARIFRAPLLPLVLAPFTLIPDLSTAVFASRLLFCMLGVLAVALLMAFTDRFAGPKAARWCGLIAAFYPSAIGMSITVLSEALFMPIMIGHLILLLTALESSGPRSTRAAIGAGGLAGLAILTRPSWLLFIPFATVLGMLFFKQRKHQFAIALISTLAAAAVLTPWWCRNAAITGRFVPTTLQVGLSLYDGLHPGATGASDEGMQFSQRIQAEQRIADQAVPEHKRVSTFEFRVDQRAKRAAMSWAFDNPLRVVTLAGAKFLRTWALWPAGGEIGSTMMRLAITVGTFFVLATSLIGTWLSLKNQQQMLASKCRWQLFVCWLPCIYFTLLHMVFVGSIRYREPAAFVLCCLSGLAAAHLMSPRSTKFTTEPH